MDPSSVNYLAVAVAALSSFLIGGLWYSPILFARAWMRETGLGDDQLRVGVARTFGGAFALSLVMAVNLAFFLGPAAGIAWGAGAGALAGTGWVASALGIIYLFERRSLLLFLINAGYQVVALTAMGAILGAWPA